uniref:Transmembrane protein n=1 Tax=Arundo donax TaxID=35708 RepID=A0A0A9H4C5_ARUDO
MPLDRNYHTYQNNLSYNQQIKNLKINCRNVQLVVLQYSLLFSFILINFLHFPSKREFN